MECGRAVGSGDASKEPDCQTYLWKVTANDGYGFLISLEIYLTYAKQFSTYIHTYIYRII